MRRLTAPADPTDSAAQAPKVRRHTFHVMGSTAVVIVVGGHAGHVHEAEARLRDLDRLWSRFRADSDVTRLNHAEGSPVRVAPETMVLLDRMVDAWRATGGAFDPTLLPALVAAGDTTSKDDPRARTTLPASARWPGDPAGISIDHELGLAHLPFGTAADAGGIGKGLAADLVVAELLADGARGALVSVGGDLRVSGEGPGGAWSIAVEDPHDADQVRTRLGLADGGVATSTPTARRWRQDGTDRHHLISPATGRPSGTPIASVTATAGTAAWAEAFTKVPYALGPLAGAVALDAAGIAALVITDDGTETTTGAWTETARPGALAL
jgi:FAD:protein FMN transferase